MAVVGLLLIAELWRPAGASSRAFRGRGVSLNSLRSIDPSIPAGFIIDSSRVGDAGLKGLGLFAVEDIASGCCLGYYEGELLTQSQYASRYPQGESQYAFLLFDSCQRRERLYIDSVNPRRSNLARFMNHDAHDCNVASRLRHWDFDRKTCFESSSDERCAGVCSKLEKGVRITAIEFTSQRLILAGEELLFNYGDLYTAFL